MMRVVKSRRLVAYVVDFFVVFLLISLVGQIKFLNPNYEKYNNTYEKLYEFQESVDEEELKDPVVAQKTLDTYSKFIYKLDKYSISQMTIVIIVIVLYYTLFPLANNNQTIGKRLMKLEIVSLKENKKIKWHNLFIRSFVYPYYIYGSALSYLIKLISVVSLTDKSYIYVSAVITVVNLMYCYISFMMMVINKEGISLHDRLSGTKVVEKL